MELWSNGGFIHDDVNWGFNDIDVDNYDDGDSQGINNSDDKNIWGTSMTMVIAESSTTATMTIKVDVNESIDKRGIDDDDDNNQGNDDDDDDQDNTWGINFKFGHQT